MSDTSDSDEGSEARKDRLARMQRFRAKREAARPAAMPCPVEEGGEAAVPCVQIGWPPDYIAYTGLWDDCTRRGWQIVDTSRRPMPDPSAGLGPAAAAAAAESAASRLTEEDGEERLAEPDCGPIPNVQFVPYKKTAWAAIMKGQVLANHYYMRSGIVRKAELATTLLHDLRSCHPETHVADLSNAAERDKFASLVASLAQRGGIWVLKAGDSSNATDMHLFDASKKDAICQLLRDTPRASWLAQKYIERPLLIDGYKFHIRATVLAIGRLKVFLHKHAIALMSGRKYTLSDLDDLSVHASNHRSALNSFIGITALSVCGSRSAMCGA